MYDDTGVAAEEQIMSIVNSAEYKYNGWNQNALKELMRVKDILVQTMWIVNHQNI